MAEQLSLGHRRQVLDRLAALSDELGQISSWLAGFGGQEDKASILVEEAWKATAAACWSLERAARTRPAGWLAEPPQQGQPAP